MQSQDTRALREKLEKAGVLKWFRERPGKWQSDLFIDQFIRVALEANEAPLARGALTSVRKMDGGENIWANGPSSLFRVLSSSRKTGRKSDYLCVFIALLSACGFPLERRGAGVNIARTASAVLGITVTDKDVSMIRARFRRDLTYSNSE